MDQGFFAGANFLMAISLTRSLSPSSYGAFGIAYALVMAAQSIVIALIVTPMVVSAPKFEHAEQYSFIATLHRISERLVFCLAGIGAVFWVVGGLSGVESLKFVSFVVLFLAVLYYFNFVRSVYYIFGNRIWPFTGSLVYACLMGVVVYLFSSAESVELSSVFIALGVCTGLVGFVSSIRLRSSLKGREFWGAGDIWEICWKGGKWELLSAFSDWLKGQGAIVICGLSLSSRGAGQMKVIDSLAAPVNHTNSSLFRIIQPYVSRKFGVWKGVNHVLKDVILLCTGIIVLDCLIVFIIFLFRDLVFTFIPKEGFSDAYGLIGWALIPYVIAGLSAVLQCVLRTTGAFEKVALINLASAVLFLGLAVWLGLSLGLLGIVIASIAAALLKFLSLVVSILRLLRRMEFA